MKSFTLRLQDATHSEKIVGVTSFVGEDPSGNFGILAGHARMMTSLIIGLARFRVGGGAWQYLAVPGAVLYFHDNVLTLSTRHYLRDNDYIRNRANPMMSEVIMRACPARIPKLPEGSSPTKEVTPTIFSECVASCSCSVKDFMPSPLPWCRACSSGPP